MNNSGQTVGNGICQWNFRKSQSFSLIEGQKWRHNYHQQTIGDRH